MAELKPISSDEIDQLRQPDLNHRKSEILCRMAIFSYLKSEAEIRIAIGNEWSNLVAWTDEAINNQGFLAWSDGVAVLSFRGTDSGADWKKNADAFFPDRHPIGGRRHDGFHNVWRQTAERVITILQSEISDDSQLWMTGHSLGGAVATAAAAEFMTARPQRVKEEYNIVTFGAPRFGNDQFQNTYDATMIDRHWFYANQRDPVPKLPPNMMGYRHGGTLKYFAKTGEHLKLSKEEAGLQAAGNSPEAQASNHWRAMDEEFGRWSQTESQYREFIDGFSMEAADPQISVTESGVEIDIPSGALQGDSLWTSAAHSSALYWQRIKALT